MNVVHSVSNRKVYEFKVSDYGHGAAVSDVQAAISWAAQVYREVTGEVPRYDDWLRARGDEDCLTFWFERREAEQ